MHTSRNRPNSILDIVKALSCINTLSIWKAFLACASLAEMVQNSILYFLKLAARALKTPGVSSLSVHSTIFGWEMVPMKAVSRLLPLTRWTMSGNVGATKL